MKVNSTETFQGFISVLQSYWINNGCSIIQPMDLEIGAGTLHPMTCLKSIGNDPISIAYVQSSRRPSDSRYGENITKLQHYYQFQVILKPAPIDIQEKYMNSLETCGIDLSNNDIRFIEDHWENPTLGAKGVGWEVWLNGIEITQFTYFQKFFGIKCKTSIGEITYGLERLAMHIQNVENVYELLWSNNSSNKLTYGDIFYQNEVEQSIYNFEYSNVKFLIKCFKNYSKEVKYLLSLRNPLVFPAYEKVLKLIHIFNLLEARKILSFYERQNYIQNIRSLSKDVARAYISKLNC
ncbi:glycine--tRNA ligase subunit alpha [Candidatus Riesia sp. GBBU]|nr:glycine--tRNA ligase subunit alpha [Candidatus Riesia sp. GBBU]ARC55049.1 glycine--tRNA ligase subunit alpha [Candidatus Riesia sp. GBBU]